MSGSIGSRVGRWLALAWVLLFVLVAARWQWRTREIGFHERHGWCSAIIAVMAHNYAAHGLSRGWAPEHNFPSSAQVRDAYGRWPPLYILGAAGAVRVFGESAATFHGFALAIMLLQITAAGLLAGRLFGWPGGAVAAVLWVTSPLMFSDGRALHLLHLTLAFMLLALAAFVEWSRRREAAGGGGLWLALGLSAAALGSSSSWEAVLLGPCLWLGGWWAGHRPLRNAGLWTALVSGAVALFWLVVFNLQREDRQDLVAILKMRMNLGDYELATFNPFRLFQVGAYGHTQSTEFARLLIDGVGLPLATIGFLSVAGYLVLPLLAGKWRGGWLPAPARAVAGCLLLLPLAWYAVFPRHALWHSYQILLALPGGCLAIAGLVALWARHAQTAGDARARRLFAWVAGVATPAALLLGHVANCIHWRGQLLPKPDLVVFGETIHRRLPARAIVLVPEVSHVPLYYGRRPMIRGVGRAEDLAATVRYLRDHGATEPIYFAARTADAVLAVTGRAPGSPGEAGDGALFVVQVDPPGAGP